MPLEAEGIKRRKFLLDNIIEPAFESAEVEYPEIAGDGDGSVKACDIRRCIADSTFCVADFTYEDIYVYYQLGCADALGKPVILIRDKGFGEWQQPVDIQGRRFVPYSAETVKERITSSKSMRRMFEEQKQNGFCLLGDEDCSGRKYEKDKMKKTCFLITRIGEPESAARKKADDVLNYIVKEAVPEGFEVIRGGSYSRRS